MSNTWSSYRSFSNARIALGRAGGSLTTTEMLAFRADHSLAKDAIWANLEAKVLQAQLNELGLTSILLDSEARDRKQFIQRPDLGRKLSQSSADYLKRSTSKSEISISIADGLSAMAILQHTGPFLEALLPLLTAYRIAPISIIRQGRVAISDEIGELLGCRLSIILIGERPGLSSPNSMGVYLTYSPKSGNTDEKRNCISNIRAEGLPYEYAAQKLHFLISESLRRKLSGVQLKDTFDDQQLKS